MLDRDKVLSLPAMMLWASLIFIPVLWPFMPKLEGRLLPVVSAPQLSNIHISKNGVSFYVLFEKYRQCDFKGLSWYDGSGKRLSLEFEPDADKHPRTRPAGKQFIGPWFLPTDNIKKTHAVVAHRCHPLWKTYTQFYP